MHAIVRPTHSALTLLQALVKVPLFALYGAWSLVRLVAGLASRVAVIKRLSAATLECPSCRTPNALHGRWSCAACSGVYHGFVGECALCECRASMMFCDRCGVAIPLFGARP